MREIVGITSTVPIEAIYASGQIPLDLNNLFITDPDSRGFAEQAELTGFPLNICCWIKGIYGAIRHNGIRKVVVVTQGDCSNTHALAEILQTEGVTVIPFAYPHDRDENSLQEALKSFCQRFDVPLEDAEAEKQSLDKVRRLVRRVDELAWKENKITGEEDHLYQISASDLKGDPEAFGKEVEQFLEDANGRDTFRERFRIGYIGIPPICSGLYEALEGFGARVVFNEMQRQFSMPYDTDSLVQQYLRYTYPYDVFFRIDDIVKEIERRSIDGIIHYVQSFCFRGIQDRIIREKINVPILTLECDRPGPLDARTMTRLEAFVEMLRD